MIKKKELEIRGVNIKVTGALKEYIEKKFKRVQRNFSLAQSAKISLEYEKNSHVAEIIIYTSLNRDVCMKTSSEDMYASVDIAFSRVVRQLRKTKEKTIDIKRYRLLKNKRSMVANL